MERNAQYPLTLKLDPRDGRVRLSQVKRLVTDSLKVLNALASDLAATENHGFQFEVVGSSVGSFNMDLRAMAAEPPPFEPELVFQVLTEDLASIRSGSFRPDLTGRLLSEYDSLVRSLGSMAADVEFRFRDHFVIIDASFRAAFEGAVKESVAEYVTVVGFVDAVNAHTPPFAFYLYPKSETEGRIECRFPAELRPAVAESLKARDVVRVTGRGMFRPVGLVPYRVDVTAPPERLEWDPVRLRRLVHAFALVPAGRTASEVIEENRRAAGLES